MSQNPFEGTKEQMAELLACIESNRGEKGALMPVLHEAQNIYGYLPAEVQTVIAEELNIPLAEVYGVATFYSQFSLTPKGKHKISICLGTACYVKGSDKILEAVEHELACVAESVRPTKSFRLKAAVASARADLRP